MPFLLVAFPLLYLFPNDTGNLWAWEIRPSMTALIMGAGYIAGAYFFVRVARATRWHRVHLGFLPITAFTTFLGIATFIYWDRFDHDHVAFWIWTGLYVTTPFLVPLAWLRNRSTDPGTLEGPTTATCQIASDRSSRPPGCCSSRSPWPSSPRRRRWSTSGRGSWTPLGAATLGAWFALPAVTAFMMGVDGRWSAIRKRWKASSSGSPGCCSPPPGRGEQFEKSSALTYVFAGGIALLLVGLTALWRANVLRTHPAPVSSAGATAP